MKMILLATATTIGAAIVTPIDGPQIVDDTTAEYLKGQGLLDGEPEDLPEAVEEIVAEVETPPAAATGGAKAAKGGA